MSFSTMEDQQMFLDMIAYRLTITDPSGIHERKQAAMKRIDEALDAAKEQSVEDVSVFEPFRAADTALISLDKEEVDIENGYRVRLLLDPKPYPWEGLE